MSPERIFSFMTRVLQIRWTIMNIIIAIIITKNR